MLTDTEQRRTQSHTHLSLSLSVSVCVCVCVCVGYSGEIKVEPPYHLSPPGRAEAERWLAIAEKLLSTRDLLGSKTFAIRARESDPRLAASDQILAVADTLLAADNPHPDWYSVLQLPRLTADPELVAASYSRIATILSPVRGRLVFADEAFGLVSHAWSVLSNPSLKSLYDNEISSLLQQSPRHCNLNINNNISNNEINFLPQRQNPTNDSNLNISNNITNNTDFNFLSRPSPQNPANEDDGNVIYNESGNEGCELGKTFWTACPYCFNMYEYPEAYEGCSMRCQNCRRAFHGAKVAAPPLNEGNGDTYLTWGFYPLAVSMEIMEKNKGGVGKWTPFSPMFSCPNVEVEVKRKPGRPPGPVVYIDDEDDDMFMDESETSEDSDGEWGSTKTRKKKKKKKKKKSRRVRPMRKPEGESVKRIMDRAVDDVLQVEPAGEEGSVDGQSGLKAGVSLGKRQVGKVPKELGKLDLNVEFSNEVEEPAPGVAKKGTVKPSQGEEDAGIEGIGFFEGLDEFLSSLPILNVVGDDKVKAA